MSVLHIKGIFIIFNKIGSVEILNIQTKIKVNKNQKYPLLLNKFASFNPLTVDLRGFLQSHKIYNF
jgi:hypothetical protein